ncbi:CRISPR-associated endonuclease Cas2 [Candidatus Giovannonibacteria bacterium RIFCSPLOWO2_01_FULL_46_13]|uniref:CRISPR-associated endonuclease Cas2 n=1 Tax=Candidatus Giovannonibacteria bacterium RIFCSPLOWO2_01_FULL_46_13 TaxID=1798352 RepID=A0A1F5X3Q8_9BACT|nr:MAG: CRISPR-associated endonuclease Cas2 [Candidatus Giovannonibacteria bacterium RIFCSPLOWO2_01_FULL_46_13]
MGLTRSPKQYFRIAKNVPKAWKEIDRAELYRTIREFRNKRLVDYMERENGEIEIILSEKGRKRALKYQLDETEIKTPRKWDKKWRIVIFDIPEKRKRAREAMRLKLRELGFKELQKSVFVHPFNCKDEIDFIVEVFGIRPHVKLILANSFTNEEELRLHFGLI